MKVLLLAKVRKDLCAIYYLIVGTRMLLEQHDSIGKQLDEEKEDEKERTTCNKDTGNKRRIQKWTRGVWFCVGGGGHIQMWQPIYQYAY